MEAREKRPFTKTRPPMNITRFSRDSRLKSGKEFAHPLQAAIQFCLRCCVRDTNVIAGTESFSRYRGNVGFAEQASSHVRGGFDVAASQESGDVGICIKRPLGQGAGYARYGAQALHDVVAKSDVFTAHLLDAVLR